MRGHVRQRGPNRWQLAIYLGRDPKTGRKKYLYETVHAEKRAQAEARLTELLHTLNTGGFVEPTRMTFGEFLDRWLESKVTPTLRESTRVWYRGIIENHIKPAIGHVPLQKLTPLDLQTYYNHVLTTGRQQPTHGKNRGDGLSAASVRAHHRTIHAALEDAVKWGFVARNVADVVDPPRQDAGRRPDPLKRDEVPRLLEVAAEKTDHPELYVLAVTTGMRLGELLGLRWQDVDLPYVYIRQTLKKGGPHPVFGTPKSKESIRTIFLPPNAVEAIRRVWVQQEAQKAILGTAYEDYGLVFCQANGRPLHPHNISRREFKGLLKAAELADRRFHDLRHTAASMMLQAGVPLKVVSAILGHSRIDITADTYSHVMPESLADAAARVQHLLFM